MISERTVGELVVERPSRSRVFQRNGIDFCCGGKKPLAEACAELGVDLGDVVSQLEAADAPTAGTTDLAALSLSDLLDHIVSTHHAYLRAELPRLDAMVRKVARVHGEKDARLVELVPVFDALRRDMGPHLDKEETILFPAIRALEAGSERGNCFDHLSAPIAVMEHEHETVGGLLARMRELCDDFVVPEQACNTWRAMLDGLRELEADTHQHVHLENNVLHRRALALADTANGSEG